MVLAERGGAVTVVAKHLGDCGRGLRNDATVAIPVVGELGDLPGANAVVVTARHECRSGGGTHGGRVESVVRDPLGGQPRQGGRVDRPTEGVKLPESSVVQHHDQDVGSVFRETLGRDPPLVLRLRHRRPDFPTHGRRREWQYVLSRRGACNQDQRDKQAGELLYSVIHRLVLVIVTDSPSILPANSNASATRNDCARLVTLSS